MDPGSKDRKEMMTQADQLDAEADNRQASLNQMLLKMHAHEEGLDREFSFAVNAPAFTPEELQLLRGKAAEWTILNTSFKEELLNRTVRPSDPILRLGAKNGPWELEMKIPQKHIGQVKLAFQREDTDVLDVDFLL